VQYVVLFAFSALRSLSFPSAEAVSQAESTENRSESANPSERQGTRNGAFADQSAVIAAFLADADGKQEHDFPAWNDFRQLVGDSQVSRALFAEMLKAEPELCAAVGGGAKRLNELLLNRVHTLAASVRDDSYFIKEGGRTVRYGFSLNNVAAILFAAGHPNAAINSTNEKDILVLVGSVVTYVDKPGQRKYRRWDNPDPGMKVILQLIGRWVVREGDPKYLANRQHVAMRFRLEDAMLAIALQLLHRPDLDHAFRNGDYEDYATEDAVMLVAEKGKKDDRSVLAPYLEKNRYLAKDFHELYRKFRPQLRDLALGAIVRLSGVAPEQYGLDSCSLGGRPDPNHPIYLFGSVEQRNRGFDLCVKIFRLLGLDKPPHFTWVPSFLFVPLADAPDDSITPLHTSPDRKMRLEIAGRKARLLEVSTGKHIGAELDAGVVGRHSGHPFTFICWSFSPNGKYVVTGCRFWQKADDPKYLPNNVGRLKVWDAATGELLAENPPRQSMGGILSVAFKEDNRTILFDAESPHWDVSEMKRRRDAIACILIPDWTEKQPTPSSRSASIHRRLLASGYSFTY
jgi:hypothetical protein